MRKTKAMNMLVEHTDEEARIRALDTAASFVVQAPAGSGKTELLMQRYLALLALVDKPEQILALTFTRKAAGEMHSRIIGAMRKAKDGYVPQASHEAKTIALAREALERDAMQGWSLLENPNRLKVQTIDSFCSSIVRQMPVLSGLGRYSITDEPQEFYREAAEKTVALVEEDGPGGDALRKALSHLGNSVKGLVDRLIQMLERRDQWLRHIGRGATSMELRTLLEGSLERLIDYELKTLSNAFPPGFMPSLAPLARYAASNMDKPGSPILKLSELDGLPQCRASALPLWQGLRELLLTKDNKFRSKVDKNTGFPAGGGEASDRKKEFMELLDSVRGCGGLSRALARISILPKPKFLETEWEALEAIINLLPLAEGMLAESFAAKGVVDFQAVCLAALKALGTEDEPTDLMLSLDLRIQHILVDEYQDTSHTQLALIEALTRGWTQGDGRTLFVVGDPMQSIYLFREAEVGLFLEARLGRIGTVAMEPLTLSRNFRSQAAIVDWVNETMGQAFPSVEDTFTGSVTYALSAAVREAVEGRGVEVSLFEGKDDRAEARKVVSILKSVPAGETTAILCRSRANLEYIVEEIKKAGIPFCAQNIDPLSGRIAVRDLMSLLRALSHPLDSVAWLSCLRAPWCGLSLSDMHALCTGDKDGQVWALLNDSERIGALSIDGRLRAQRFTERMGKALALWGRRTPSEVLRGLWISLGGPACLEGAQDREDALRFLSLAESIESSGNISIEELEGRMKGLYAEHAGSSETMLSIMTIHKAKGLEFDNVIIPGMGKYARGDDKKLLVWMERGEEDLLLAPIEKKHGGEDSGIYGYLSALQKEKSTNEDIRLLYVAATRAKKALHLLGHVKGAEGGVEADSRSFLSRIAHALREDMISLAEPAEASGEAKAKGLKRLPASWELPAPVGPVASSSVFFTPNADEPRFYWAGEAVRHLGTAVHRYFCRIAKEGLEKWDGQRIKGEASRMRMMLKSLGLSENAAQKAAQEGVEVLIKATQDERGRWTLDPHEEAASELPMTAVVNNEIIRVVIDRTFVDKDGVRWVVDFKTGSHSGGSLEEFLEHERERYKGQLLKYEAVLRAYGERRPIRKGLYYPAHRAWVEV